MLESLMFTLVFNIVLFVGMGLIHFIFDRRIG